MDKDWDKDLKNLLAGETPDGPYEVDWTDPRAVEAERVEIARLTLETAGYFYRLLSAEYADIPPAGRLAILGGITSGVDAFTHFAAGVLLSRHAMDFDRVAGVFGAGDEEATDLMDDADIIRDTEQEARECGSGDLHGVSLADGSNCYVAIGGDGEPDYMLEPFWSVGR